MRDQQSSISTSQKPDNATFPYAVMLLLIPSWITFFLFERDKFDTDHPLYYYIPDLTENPTAVAINLTVTPLVNTEVDQIILITGLIGIFGTQVEWRMGMWRTLGLFWLASAAAALGAGALLHVLYPMFPDVEMFGPGGWDRVFNGASAGAFAFYGAFAALSRRPLVWLGLFVIWEPIFWFFISNDFTSIFHFIAVATGFAFAWPMRQDESMDSSRSSATDMH